jgi:hypothetical protein
VDERESEREREREEKEKSLQRKERGGATTM